MKKSMVLLYKNTAMLIILQASGYIFPLITFPYLTRVLGPNNYGITIFVNAFMVYFQTLIDFGFLLSGTQKCAELRNDKERLSQVACSIIQAKLVLSLLGLTILIFFIVFVEALHDKALFTFLAFIPVVLGSLVPDFVFRGIEQMGTITYRNIASKVVYVFLVLVLVKQPDDYLFLPVINAFSVIMTIVWSWVALVKKFGIKARIAGIFETVRIMKESSVFFFSRIASTVYNASNVFLLGLIGVSNTDIGYFGVANNLINVIRSVFSPLADSIYPYMIAQKNYRLIKKILLIGIPMTALGTIVLFLGADQIIQLLGGPAYKDSVPYFKTMLPIVFITLPLYLLGFPVLSSLGKSNEANMSVIYASAFHLVGLISLFLFQEVTMFTLIFLTILSETIMLLFRVYYIYLNRSQISM